MTTAARGLMGVGLEFATLSPVDGNRPWKDVAYLFWGAFDVKFPVRKPSVNKS